MFLSHHHSSRSVRPIEVLTPFQPATFEIHNNGEHKNSENHDPTHGSSLVLQSVCVTNGFGGWYCSRDIRRKNFDDKIPARNFDNFQFVNFTDLMAKDVTPSEKEAAFALAALMEVPIQYTTIELGILGCRTGKAKKVVPRPPPVPNVRRALPSPELTQLSAPTVDEQSQESLNLRTALFTTYVIEVQNITCCC